MRSRPLRRRAQTGPRSCCATGTTTLELQVSDDREGDASERLPGLRDRVGLYGGNLRADRTDDGSYRLRARLPLEGTH